MPGGILDDPAQVIMRNPVLQIDPAASGFHVFGAGGILGRPANQNTSPAEIKQTITPLSAYERAWQNYGSKMVPEEVLGSEPVWGAAAQARDAGLDPNEAFANMANHFWHMMGANQYITPDLARRYMSVELGRMRGIGAVPNGLR